jgi:hypothetical protein
MPLGLRIGQPPSNGVIIIGETTLVSGIATGTGGAEPVLVDSVTVQIGGGPPVTAGLSFGGLARDFKAEVLVPGPPGPVVVTVTAHYGAQHLTKSVTPPLPVTDLGDDMPRGAEAIDERQPIRPAQSSGAAWTGSRSSDSGKTKSASAIVWVA